MLMSPLLYVIIVLCQILLTTIATTGSATITVVTI